MTQPPLTFTVRGRPLGPRDTCGPGHVGDRDHVARFLRERVAARPELAGWEPDVATLGRSDALTQPPEPAVRGDRGEVSVHLGEGAAVVGMFPAVGDARRPCPHCLAVRWQLLRPDVQRAALENGTEPHVVGADPLLTPFALDALWELISALVGDSAAQPERVPGTVTVRELRLDTLRVRAHPLTAHPDCPRCGTRGSATPDGGTGGNALEVLTRVPGTDPGVPDDPGDIARVLTATPKPRVDAFRAVPAAELDLPLDALANPVCGIIGPGAEPMLDTTTTAPVTGRIAVRDGGELYSVHWSGLADVYDHSAVLAACEGMERCASRMPGTAGESVVASHAELVERGVPALDPVECGVFGPDSPALAAGFSAYSPDARVPWVRGHSLRDHRSILVPEQFVCYGQSEGWPQFVGESSNGCASGGTLAEAVLHGLIERVERDAFLLAWHGRALLPEIDTTTHLAPETRHMIARVGLIGYDVRFFDTRIDLPFPVVTAVATRRPGRGDGLGATVVSAGASLDPWQAVHSALSEIASVLTDFPARTAARLDELRAMAADYTRVVELRDHAALFGLPEMTERMGFPHGTERRAPLPELFADWERDRPRGLDLADDVRFCRDVLAENGFALIAVDQTSPEQRLFGFHTCRVLVPGLVPIDFGWHRQRVFDMTRALTALRAAGLHDTDLTPSDLHRVPHPYM